MECRVLLANIAVTPSAMPIMPAGITAQLTNTGLEISQTPSAWQYTPDYILQDSNPQLAADGTLAPFSSSSPVGLTPTQVRHAYGVDQIMFGSVAGNGAGQTIAIIDAYDYPTITTDLHAFDQQFGLPDPPSVTKVNETGGSTLPGTDPEIKGDDWEVEEALDVEWSHAMAPGANILLIECSAAADTDLIDNAVSYARSAPGVVAVTMSFGRAEGSTDTSLNSYFTTPSGHTGVTFLASTGDTGEPGSFPAKSPNVVAVGGTTLSVDSAGDYQGETGWSDSGGGISTYQAQPSYQAGVVTQSTTERTIPDVSFDANPSSGVAIYDSYDFGTTTPWIDVGGTSLSSPSWAGLIAVMDQGRIIAGNGTLDGPTQTLPRLYQISAGDYHDITSGSNGYSAGVGYDLVTGRGSPIANSLIPQLLAGGPYVVSSSPTGSLTVTPPSTVDFNFSTAMNASSFSIASDVDSFTGPGNVDLRSTIAGYTWLNNNTTLQVTFAAQSTDGQYSMTIGPQILSSGGSAMDQNENGTIGETPGDEYTASWGYDTNPLEVVSTTPANGSWVTLPMTSIQVQFNEAFDQSMVSPSNLTLSQGTVTAASVINSTTVQYTLSAITTEGTLNVSMAAGALNKLSDELPMEAYSGTVLLDYGTVGMPATSALGPLGTQIYESTSSGTIGVPADTDSFTISLDAGQTLTAVVHPTATSLRPSITVLGPNGNSLGTYTAAAANQDAFLQSIPVTAAGTYTIVAGSDGTTTGGYTVEALLNAAVEAEEHNGPSDDTIATAQDLTTAFKSLPNTAAMASVVGKLATSATDYYSIALVAGESFTAVLGSLTGTGAMTLGLYSSAGALLQSGVTTATNVSAEINDYVVSSAGTYYLKVTGNGNDYSLTVTTNAAFDLEPNNSQATAQSLGSTQKVVVGSLGLGTGVSTTITFGELSPGVLDNAVIDGMTFKFQINGVDSSDATFGESTGPGTTTYVSPPLAEGNTEGVLTMTLPGASTSLSFGMALSTSGTITNAATVELFDGSTLVTTIPVTASVHSPYTYSEALFSYSGEPITQAVVSFNSAAAQRFVMDNITFLAPSADPGDYYSLPFTAGQQITLSTSTPADGPGQFGNTLDPAIDLLNSAGTVVATNDDGGPDGRNALLSYTVPATGTYTVRVYATNGTMGEYVLNTGSALVIAAPTDVHEGDAPVNGTISVAAAPASNLTIALTSSDSSRLSVPSSVVLPAGQTSVTFPITVIDDTLLNGPEAVSISASAMGYQSGSANVEVHDNETATLTVNLPSNATEGDGTISGTITSSAAPTQDIVVALSSNNTSKLTVPATVTLKAGETSVNFTANVVDNTIIDGTQNATVIASVENWTSGSATVAVADNDNTLSVSVPSSAWEGQTLTNAGTVTIGGTLSTDLVVNLTSDPNFVSVPATVTIPAGQTSATFTITLVTNPAETGTVNSLISASATGLVSEPTNPIAIHDSTVDHFAFDPILGTETAGVGFAVTARAYNIAGEVIPVYAGTASLSSSGQSGYLSVSPNVLAFTNGVASGTVSVAAVDPAASLTLTSGLLSATSNTFALQPGALTGYTFSAVSSPQLPNLPFTETITATDANGYTVSDFNGTTTLSGLVGGPVAENMLGNTAYNSTFTGLMMVGYAFTPNQNVVATAVRSFWGSSVSIWTSTGTLLESQPVTAAGGAWTVTPLTTPLTLQAGMSYVVGAYTSSGTVYRYTGAYPTFAWGSITASRIGSSNQFPTGTDNTYRYLVDLQVNVGAATPVAITPGTVTFTNGVWTGNVSISQAATGVYLHVDNGAGQIGNSNTFTVLSQAIALNLPSDVHEGDGEVSGTLSVSPAPSSDLTVTLSSSDASRIGVPATVIIPAGQNSVLIELSVVDDSLLNGLEAVAISASAAGYTNAAQTVNIHDNESATLSVSLPANASEGAGSVMATVTSSAAPTQNITIALSSSNPARATVPATVVLPAGQTSVNFNVSIIDDTLIDGNAAVNIGASVENWVSGSGTITIADNDNTIAVSVPSSGWEGQTLTGVGIVTIGGTLSTPLVVSLSSGNTNEVSVPTTVAIPAGQTSATFNLTLTDDGLKDGTQNVSITGMAPGLSSGSGTIAVHDATLDHLVFDAITTPETADTPFTARVTAYNSSNEVIQDYSASGTLGATGQAGNLSITPTAIIFSSGVWTGAVSLNAVDPAAQLTVTSKGVSASSNTFALQAGPIVSLQFSSIASPQAANVPFSETITATDANGFVATGYNGTATLSGAVGTSSAQNMLGNTTPTGTYSGTITAGYLFTPNQNVTVTGVRSYWGSNVSLWTSSGTLLLSQAITATGGSWTTTNISTPITLQAGTSYLVAAYTTGVSDHISTTPTFSWGTITAGRAIFTGYGFPTGGDSFTYLVDLQVAIGGASSVSVSPGSITFTNGVWTGNVTALQGATGMHLHVDDGSGQTADSGVFNVTAPQPAAPAMPVLAAASDTGVSNSDDLTNLNNTSGKTLQFTVGSTISGATVFLYANGILIGQATASGTTTTVTTDGVTSLADGTYSITARQSVLGSVQSVDSTALGITIDTVAPAAPAHAAVLDPASDSGINSTDGITNINTPTLDVNVAAPYFRIYAGSALVSGSYATGTSVTLPVQADGTYQYYVAAVDAAGNQSALIGPTPVTIITSAPTFGAAMGSADGTFGTSGMVTGAAGGINAIAQQADGKIVAVGANPAASGDAFLYGSSVELQRFNSNGTVDTSFGANGVTVTAISNGALANGVAIQSDGKILICGTIYTGTAQGGSLAALIARYNTNGTLDTSFGIGGELTFNYSQIPIGPLMGIVIQPDGKIVCVGNSYNGSYGAISVVRLNSDGTFDTTFNGTGWTVINQSGLSDFPTAVALQSDGKIVITGDFPGAGGTKYDMGAVRLMSNGALDTSFGTGGWVLTSVGSLNDNAHAIAVTPDGKILVGGESQIASSYNLFGIVRYTSSGALDTTFNGTGIVLTQINSSVNASVNGLTVQSDGKIIATGNADGTGIILRLTTSGSFDTSFGTGGIVKIPFGTGSSSNGAAALIDSNGKLLVGGTAGSTTAVSRYIIYSLSPTPTLLAASDSGVSSSDGITNINTPTLSLSIPTGDYARIYCNGSLISSLYYSGSTFTAPVQADGTAVYTMSVVDAAGNVAQQSTGLSVTVDTKAPATPPAPVLQPGSDSGSSNSDGITNDTTPTFNVSSTDSYFRTYVNGTQVGGNYLSGSTFTLPAQASGTYLITTASVDAAGNVSAQSPADTLVIDTLVPRVSANSLVTSNVSPSLSGTVSESTASVQVTINGQHYAAFNNGNGGWTLPANTIAALPALGSYPVTVLATDLAGNSSEATATVQLIASGIIYVDLNATGANDGSSWADAYTSLSAALAQAVIGQTIEVAQGVYYPTSGTDRTASFAMKAGVALYGGYAGNTSASPGQRSISLYPTILSGDIGAAGNNTDNSYHVITAASVTAASVLDGFTIEAGNANGSGTNANGGGILVTSTSAPAINNCIFTLDAASGYGGAIYSDNGSPLISSTVFAHNKAGYGGAIYSTDDSAVQLDDCVFSGNTAAYNGAIMNTNSTLTAINCTFAGNSATQSGAGAIGNSTYGNLSMTNSILWGDSSPNGSEINTTDQTSHSTATYSDIQGGYAGTGNINTNPQFVRTPNPGADGIWGSADDDDGDLHLLMTSPAIDAGNNASVPAGSTDADGNSRIIDFPGVGTGAAVVDMGAYELGMNLDQIIVPAGQQLSLPAGGYAFTANGLSLGAGSSLNIGDDSLTIQYTSDNDPIAQIAGWIDSGFANGQWSGAGIVGSATLGAPANTTGIGYFDDGSQITIRRSWIGDANLDSVINADDLSLMLLGQSQNKTRWQDGNFNYDNQINADDWISFMYALAYSKGQSISSFSTSNIIAGSESADAVSGASKPAASVVSQATLFSNDNLASLIESPESIL